MENENVWHELLSVTNQIARLDERLTTVESGLKRADDEQQSKELAEERTRNTRSEQRGRLWMVTTTVVSVIVSIAALIIAATR